MTLPNVLSGIRILLVPPVFWLILQCSSSRYPWLLFVFALAVMLDFLDGFFARRLSQETELGRILDPLADKLLTLFCVIGLSLVSDFPLWITIPIVIRDLVILLASSLMYTRRRLVKGSIVLGKITFFLMSLVIYIYIIDLSDKVNLMILKQFFSVTCLGFILWSFEEYFLVYQRVRDNG